MLDREMSLLRLVPLQNKSKPLQSLEDDCTLFLVDGIGLVHKL